MSISFVKGAIMMHSNLTILERTTMINLIKHEQIVAHRQYPTKNISHKSNLSTFCSFIEQTPMMHLEHQKYLEKISCLEKYLEKHHQITTDVT